jgi:hypothetical protein
VRLSGALEEILSLSTDISEINEHIELVLWLLVNIRIGEYLSCRCRLQSESLIPATNCGR